MSDGTCEVPTRCGRVAGAVRSQVGAFPGVPYAAPATGPRRFGSPVAATPWTGARRADEFGPTPSRAAGGLFDQLAGEHRPATARPSPATAWCRPVSPTRSSRPTAGRRVESNGIVMVCRTGGWNSSRMRMTRNG
ncbi:carboxylesterase family protein [Nocardia abscessus]|uniref:carboxylesterase family protein n=1 Tax=Nocardia abscessus TaxID=120957 RepID=UPI003CC7C49A